MCRLCSFNNGRDMAEIEIVIVDITTLEVDAIVNAANSTLLGGGGVDGAVHRAAGSGLLRECATIGGCPTGEARITGGYNLLAKFVIHTVGPIWHGGSENESQLLASCYRRSLELAEKHGCRSIAFPAISCGAYGFPIQNASQIAMQQACDYLAKDESVINRVVFACSSSDVQFALEDALRLVT